VASNPSASTNSPPRVWTLRWPANVPITHELHDALLPLGTAGFSRLDPPGGVRIWQDGFDAWIYSLDNDIVDDLPAPHVDA
jgi:hypothetical protein